MHDSVIRGGLVVDGSGSAGRRADVAIDDGVITDVGDDVGSARRTIDADAWLMEQPWPPIFTSVMTASAPLDGSSTST